MITTKAYLLSVLKTLCHFDGVGLSTGVHVEVSELRLVKLSRLHVLYEGLPRLNFEIPNGAPDPLQGSLSKTPQQAHRDWF